MTASTTQAKGKAPRRAAAKPKRSGAQMVALITHVMNAKNVRTTVHAKKHNRREQQETYIQENVLNRQFPVV